MISTGVQQAETILIIPKSVMAAWIVSKSS
jgi:hypothetical protein